MHASIDQEGMMAMVLMHTSYNSDIDLNEVVFAQNNGISIVLALCSKLHEVTGRC